MIPYGHIEALSSVPLESLFSLDIHTYQLSKVHNMEPIRGKGVIEPYLIFSPYQHQSNYPHRQA